MNHITNIGELAMCDIKDECVYKEDIIKVIKLTKVYKIAESIAFLDRKIKNLEEQEKISIHMDAVFNCDTTSDLNEEICKLNGEIYELYDIFNKIY